MERKQTAQCCVIPERREMRAVSPVTAVPFCQGVCGPEPPGGDAKGTGVPGRRAQGALAAFAGGAALV